MTMQATLRFGGTLALALFATAAASAIDLVKGYVRDGNDPLQLGSDFLFDQAATGGGDASVQTEPGFFGWAAEYAGLWDIGTDVSITGLAIPIHSNTNAGTNTTQNGDFTFTFFDLGGGADPDAFDGYNFTEMTGESILGTATATFSNFGLDGVGNQTDEYFLNFDTPLDFTATSTGLAFHVQSTSTIRLKVNNPGLLRRATRVGLDGTRFTGNNSSFAATLAGTPVALDPPPPPALPHRAVASLDEPGNRRWNTIEDSQERYALSSPQQGDYNGDGLTNAADYTVYRDNLGGDAELTLTAGSRDPNAAGVVGAADLAYWSANYGSPSTVAVNDPSVPGITAAYRGGAVGEANVYQNTLIDGTLASRQDGSFEIWFKPDDLASGDQMLYEVGGSGNGMYISLQDDELSLFVNGLFEGNDQLVSTTLTDAEWTQVVAVVHNTFEADIPSADDFVDLYVNGVLAATSVVTSDLNRWAGGNQSGLGRVGGNFASGGPILGPNDGSELYPLNGEIAIIEYAVGAWDATEVLTRYNAITGASANAVPEPTSALLLGLSFAAGTVRRRR